MDEYQRTLEYIEAQTPKLTELRRDLHRYPETGWLEVRTASIIIETLERLGYETITGTAACNPESRFSLPSKDALQAAYVRAGEQGAPDRYRELVRDGLTAVIGILRCGEGPVIALRFDIDALPITEKDCMEHFPYREGFCSVNEGCMHACGHDGHTAIGLTVADVLMKMKDQLKGTVKLIFQPAEEGARGAKSIVDRGHLDDVDYLIGEHIMNGSEYDMALGVYGTLATVKLDVTYEGQSAHAGAEPEAGRNALQAAACAVMNLYGIPRNSKGVSRINVGTLHSGNGRNLISDWATMEVEVRGETTEICDYMEEQAVRMIENSARMYEVDYNITKCGGAASIECDAELMDEIRRICADKLSFLRIAPENRVLFGASEDFSYLSQRVKEMGGKATYIPLFTPLSGELHKTDFDYKEEVLKHGVQIFSILVSELLSKSKEKTNTDS